MIKINLAPIEEYEEPYWWVPDIITFALILGLTIAVGNYYLGIKQAEIERQREEEQNLLSSLDSMKGDVTRHEQLVKKIEELESLRQSFSKITQSKLARYLPVILLEQIQVVKPEGVWLSGIYFKSDKDQQGDGTQAVQKPSDVREIEITGYAFDHIILAEFMTLLKATENQEFAEGDVRTHVYFDEINLHSTGTMAINRKVNGQDEPLGIVEFKIAAHYIDRTGSEPKPATQLLSRRKTAAPSL